MRKSAHTHEYSELRRELRAARSEEGLSQRDLAQRLKVPHSWVAKVESGERRIDFVECCWFFAACGADALEVFARLTRSIIPRRTRRSTGGR